MFAVVFAARSLINREAKPTYIIRRVCTIIPLAHIGNGDSSLEHDISAFLNVRAKRMLANSRSVSLFLRQVRIAGSIPRDTSLPIRTGHSATSPSRLFRSTSTFDAQIMLTKAIQQHQPAPAAKQYSLSQTLLPSSSPSSRPDLHSNRPWRKQPQSDRSTISQVNPVLKPSAFSKSQSQLSAQGHVANLHDAVYFDENDFEDDADLDLEVEDPMSKGHLSVSKADINLPAEQKTPISNNKGIVVSSAPLAWSSSPLQHKATPPNAGLLRRTNNAHAPDAAKSRTAVDVGPDSDLRPSKRRTLPWPTDGDKDVTNDATRGPPAHVQKIIDRHRANKAQRQQDNGDFTPLPKDNHLFQYSWNKTASAMKEEQRKLRQANKRIVKSNDASNEDIGQAIRANKKQKLEPVFLSQEQQRVLKLVVESGKSVFFTGSAGTFLWCQMQPQCVQSLNSHRYRKVSSHARDHHRSKAETRERA